MYDQFVQWPGYLMKYLGFYSTTYISNTAKSSCNYKRMGQIVVGLRTDGSKVCKNIFSSVYEHNGKALTSSLKSKNIASKDS